MTAASAVSVQYRVAFSKKDEAVEGPDDADVVVSIGVADAGLDPSVAYMQGRLKLDEMITRRLKLEDVNEAFRAMKAGEVARSVLMFE